VHGDDLIIDHFVLVGKNHEHETDDRAGFVDVDKRFPDQVSPNSALAALFSEDLVIFETDTKL
jgi:hypothetical protein